MIIFGLFASFEAFWSLKNDLNFSIKIIRFENYDLEFSMYENYKTAILS